MGAAMSESEKTPRRSTKKLRCAIYTRKSSDEGLEKVFKATGVPSVCCCFGDGVIPALVRLAEDRVGFGVLYVVIKTSLAVAPCDAFRPREDP
jgi:hypothetical protein